MKKLIAEFFGTSWLVLGGCGSAVLAANFPGSGAENSLGLGFLGVSLAFGLTVVTMAYAIGHISGCHLNPAVSIGLWMGGRFDSKELPGYIIAQVLGGLFGAGVLYLIASGTDGFSLSGGFAANGYGEHSPGGYNMTAAFVTEVVMTFFFLIVILGATHGKAPAGFAGLPSVWHWCLSTSSAYRLPIPPLTRRAAQVRRFLQAALIWVSCGCFG
jgi:aquaporin Z